MKKAKKIYKIFGGLIIISLLITIYHIFIIHKVFEIYNDYYNFSLLTNNQKCEVKEISNKKDIHGNISKIYNDYEVYTFINDNINLYISEKSTSLKYVLKFNSLLFTEPVNSKIELKNLKCHFNNCNYKNDNFQIKIKFKNDFSLISIVYDTNQEISFLNFKNNYFFKKDNINVSLTNVGQFMSFNINNTFDYQISCSNSNIDTIYKDSYNSDVYKLNLFKYIKTLNTGV